MLLTAVHWSLAAITTNEFEAIHQQWARYWWTCIELFEMDNQTCKVFVCLLVMQRQESVAVPISQFLKKKILFIVSCTVLTLFSGILYRIKCIL